MPISDTDLLAACQKGNIATVREGLASGGNINAKNEKGLNLLHEAAESGNVELAEFLLERTENRLLNTKTNIGSTPLHRAAGCLHPQMVDLFIRKGAEIDHPRPQYKTTPLYDAVFTLADDQEAESRRLSVVQLLIEAGANIHNFYMPDNDWALLTLAAQAGNLDVVNYLIHRGVNVQSKALQTAALYGHIQIVERLIRERARIDEQLIVNVERELERSKKILSSPPAADISNEDIQKATRLVEKLPAVIVTLRTYIARPTGQNASVVSRGSGVIQTIFGFLSSKETNGECVRVSRAWRDVANNPQVSRTSIRNRIDELRKDLSKKEEKLREKEAKETELKSARENISFHGDTGDWCPAYEELKQINIRQESIESEIVRISGEIYRVRQSIIALEERVAPPLANTSVSEPNPNPKKQRRS